MLETIARIMLYPARMHAWWQRLNRPCSNAGQRFSYLKRISNRH